MTPRGVSGVSWAAVRFGNAFLEQPWLFVAPLARRNARERSAALPLGTAGRAGSTNLGLGIPDLIRKSNPF